MQNKSAIWLFTILLVLASIYTISFSWVVSGVEKEAEDIATRKLDSLSQTQELSLFQKDSAFQKYELDHLSAVGGEKVYPVLGYTFNECKRKEINLGLDLQGGMHVTLEVSVPGLIQSLAASNSSNPTFVKIIDRAKEMQKSSQVDFATLFGEAQKEVAPDFKLASVFHNLENKEKIAPNATNDEIISIIKSEADDAIKRTEQVLRKRVDNLGVVQPKIQRLTNTGRIIVELPGVKDKTRVRKILQGTAKLEFWDAFQNHEIFPLLDRANNILRATYKTEKSDDEEKAGEIAADSTVATDSTLAQNTDVIEGDSTKEESLEDLLNSEEGLDSTTVANMTDEEKIKLNPLFAFLQPNQDPQSAQVGFARVLDTAAINANLARKDIKRLFPPRTKFFWDAKPFGDAENLVSLYAVKVPKGGKAKIEGDVIVDARVGSDQLGNPTVNMTMNATGAKDWREMTKQASTNANDLRSVAVVLDGHVYSCPRVQGEIPTGNTEISGRFDQQEAADLAGVLKAGKLPAPSHIIEEAIVGPSLGEKSINDGSWSFLVALIIVLIYMMFYYSKAGGIANIALIANVFFITGVLASIGATLTLPGVAGIVLTIGMSVDANVLIYERIREELAAGKGIKLAIQDGYKNAYSSILDANITTLLTGIILVTFGTGPIQGFATTLIIGIFTSLFSAIVLTRLVFSIVLDKSKSVSFATKMTEGAFKNIAINFVGKRKTYYIVSGVIIILGIGSLFTKGLNYGVDFQGGRSYIVRFDDAVNTDEVTKSLSNVFVDAKGNTDAPEVKTFGASNQVKITTKFMINESGNDVDQVVEGKLYEGLAPFYKNKMGKKAFLEELTSQKVEPTIADDIKTSAIWAVIISLIVIFLYILIRFRKWQYSLGALFAMTHDVLVVLGLFSIFYGILPFSMEIDQAFIAAILTVVGYSINDTVVVFDRIREYLGLHPKKNKKEVINDALNSTLSRTINTSISTFIVLLIIFLFGGEVIRGFVFALMIGVIVGTYSSLSIATPVVVDFDKSIKDAE